MEIDASLPKTCALDSAQDSQSTGEPHHEPISASQETRDGETRSSSKASCSLEMDTSDKDQENHKYEIGVSENAATQSTEKPLQEDSSCETSAFPEEKGGEKGQGDSNPKSKTALDSAQDSQSTGEPHHEPISASQETRDGETRSSSKASCSLEMDTSDKDQENHKHEIGVSENAATQSTEKPLQEDSSCETSAFPEEKGGEKGQEDSSPKSKTALDSAQDSQSTGEPHHEPISASQETRDGETRSSSKASCSLEMDTSDKDQENHKHEIGVSENAATQSTEKPLQEDSSCETSAFPEEKGGEKGQGDSSPKSKTGLVEGTDTQSTQPPLQQKDWASREGSACPKEKDAENVQVDSDRKDKSIGCKQDIDKEIQQGSDQRNKSGNSVVDTASQPFLPEVSAVVDKSDVRRRKEKVAEKDQNDSFRKETTDEKRPTHPKITSEPADEKNKTMIPQEHGDNQQSYNSALPQLSPFLAVLLVLLVVAGLWLFKWPHQSQSAEKGENRSIEVFRRQITRLEYSFPSQRKELWRRSRIHMEKHLQSEEPTEPVSMILTAGRKAERTLHCLASGLARAYSSALNASALHIDGLSKAALDSDRVKLEIDEELTAAFEGNKRAAVIHRFEELPPDSTLIFYKYCDHENAAYKAVSLIFTVLLEEDELGTQLNLGSVEEKVQDHIQEKFFISVQPTVFDKMDTDKFGGLWSRISHLILPVSTEEKSERLGCDL
ncbi:TOIP1 protein, partial [Atractosteus spatula]|nr:TOIP1 protein [Atractosteus spatula]